MFNEKADYMHIYTRGVRPGEDWIEEITIDELEYFELDDSFENRKKVFLKFLDKGYFSEVFEVKNFEDEGE